MLGLVQHHDHQLIPYSIFSFFYFRSSTFAFFALQVLCTIGKLKEIPQDFPLETEEITISNQDIRTIQPSSKHLYFFKDNPSVEKLQNF